MVTSGGVAPGPPGEVVALALTAVELLRVVLAGAGSVVSAPVLGGSRRNAAQAIAEDETRRRPGGGDAPLRGALRGGGGGALSPR